MWGVKVFPSSDLLRLQCSLGTHPALTLHRRRPDSPTTEGGAPAGSTQTLPMESPSPASRLDHHRVQVPPCLPPGRLHFDAMPSASRTPAREESLAAGCRGYEVLMHGLALQRFMAPGENPVGTPLLRPRGGCSPQARHLLLLNGHYRSWD